MAEIKYFTTGPNFSILEPTFEEDINGHIPALVWIDENGHGKRAVVTSPNFSGYMYKEIGYSYGVWINPLGTSSWYLESTHHIGINNNNYVDALTGLIIENPLEQIYDEENNYHYKWEEYPGAIPQFDFFVMLIGKNLWGEPISLYYLFITDMLRLENLELDN
jgi:hypothetical protein